MFDGCTLPHPLLPLNKFAYLLASFSDFEEACSIVFKSLRERGYSARFLRKVKHETLCQINSGELITPPGLSSEPEGEFWAEPCEHGFCHTCNSVEYCESIVSNTTKFTFKLRQDLNCHSSNIIYLIHCHQCKKQYIGQTKRSLRLRVNNHRHDILNHIERPTAISTHFNNEKGCMFEDFRITPIFACPRNGNDLLTLKSRLDLEQFFIQKLRTYQPYGLNIATRRFDDIPNIPFIVPYSGLASMAGGVVRKHYKKLQETLPEVFSHSVVTVYSRNKNLKDCLVSSQMRKITDAV